MRVAMAKIPIEAIDFEQVYERPPLVGLICIASYDM
jgi:hypothetical protein